MKRTPPIVAVSITAVLAAASFLCSCKDVVKKLTGKTEDDGVVERPGAAKKAAGAAQAGCDLPVGALRADFRVKARCTVEVDRTVTVDEDATLTIEAGARLRFKTGAGLVVRRGALVAVGTEKEPITFTSGSATPAAGDWDGIRFEADVAAGTTLERVVIEHAGKAGGYDNGAITFWGSSSPGRVAITNSVIRNNAQRAVDNRQPKATFAKFDNNELKDNDGTSLRLHPNVVGSIGANKLSEPVRVVAGQVNQTATWPKTEQPYFIEGELSIQGAGSPAVLTLPEGGTLKFGSGVRMDVGEGAGGGVVAKRVTFTSADPVPAPGAWVGLLIYAKASSTRIDGSTIEYAGRAGNYGKGAITFWDTKAPDVPSFEVKNTVFRNNKAAAIFSRGGCGALEVVTSGNRSEDVPLCDPK